MGWLESALWLGALVALAVVLVVWAQARWTRYQVDRELEQALEARQVGGVEGESPTLTGMPDRPVRPQQKEGDPIGRIGIPELGLSAAVLEGTTSAILRRGVGHIPSTELPGEGGNVGLAAHRDTFFRALRDVAPGQEVVFETLWGERRYEVVSTRVVDPTATEVLGDHVLRTFGEETPETLTLVTCYPFDYIGPAPQRFIVHARLREPEDRGSIEPAL